MRNRITVLCLVGATFVTASDGLASERTVSIKDYTGRGFAPDLVNYTVPTAGSEKLQVFDAAGNALPVQVAPGEKGQATLSFVAQIPPGEEVKYTIRTDGKGAARPEGVTIIKEADALVLSNKILAVKVPAAVEKIFDKPVPASTLPAPILAFRGPDGSWRGAGTVLTQRPVRAFRVTQTASGPVFAEVRYEFEYEGGGYYRATIRVVDQAPLAEVTEEYDLGKWDNSDFWQLNLSKGWTPDNSEIMRAQGHGDLFAVTYQSLAELEAKAVSGVNGMTTPGSNPGEIPVRSIVPEGFGDRNVTSFGVHGVADREVKPSDYPLAIVAMLHKGNWRRPNGIPVYVKGPEVLIRFPMGVAPMSWLKEPASDNSPFSCHEHDPSLPQTYGRRMWGLVLAQPAMKVLPKVGEGVGNAASNLYGTIGLDRYKDYILSWPDKKLTYPRVYITPEGVTKYRAAMAADPNSPLLDKDVNPEFALKSFYWFTGDPQTALAELPALQKDLDENINFIVRSLAIGSVHATYAYGTVMAHAESVLSWSGLPADQRELIRAKLALLAYLMVEPDVMSHGAGTHHGNPNMGVVRQMDMLNIMALVSDHPMHQAWRDHMAMFMAYKAGSFMAPEGAWFEFGAGYHMYGYGGIMRGIMGLQATDAPHAKQIEAYNRADFDYFLNLLTPLDARFRSRIIPGLANSAPGTPPAFYQAMGTVAQSDPEFAANLRWAWDASGQGVQVGGERVSIPAMGRPWIAPKEPVLTSRIYPGFGVIFRAHQGPDETCLFFRSGYSWSHGSLDQGHIILYSKGAPLVPSQPFQYYNPKNTDFDYQNVLRFGGASNGAPPYAWADGNIIDHAFGPTVDYAWSSVGYPDWYITPGAAPGWQDSQPQRKLDPGLNQKEGAFTWDRQILFLKGATGSSPNYFVIRDTTRDAGGQSGKLASWFNLNLLGRKANVTVTGPRVTLDTEWPTKLDILFPGRTELPVEMNEDNPPLNLTFGGYAKVSNVVPGAPLSRDWLGKDGEPAVLPGNPPVFEQHVQLRLQGAPGQEYCWVLYPRGAGEAAPIVTQLAPGVVKVDTVENTDYAFLSTELLNFEGEGVTFSGYAGSVRVSKAKDGSVTLALTSGPGKVGYKGSIIESAAPFERKLEPQALKKQLESLPAPTWGIVAPAPLAGPQAVVPGVTKAMANGVTEYVVSSAAPVLATDGDVQINASQATIQSGADSVRFIVPERAYVQLSVGAVGVRGMGPFDLTFTPDGITGEVEGDIRTLVTTWPKNILRPMYHQDGVRWYAGFSDEPSITKGTTTPQFSLAIGVSASRRQIAISEWTWPAMPPDPARRTLE